MLRTWRLWHEWQIKYYSSGGFIKQNYVWAKTKGEAISSLRNMGVIVIEIISCRIVN